MFELSKRDIDEMFDDLLLTVGCVGLGSLAFITAPIWILPYGIYLLYKKHGGRSARS